MKIQHNSPLISDKNINDVIETLRTGMIGSGRACRELEQHFSNYLGSGFCATTNSGTSALYIALKVGGIRADSTVVVPTYACTALLDAVYACGATAVACDTAPNNFNPSADEFITAISKCSADAVIAVHTFGRTVDIKKIVEAFPKVLVIEDCCHSLGAQFDGVRGGYGSISVYSFYATKIITGGEGGLIWSRSDKIIEQCKSYLATHWGNGGPCFNLRMSDLNACLIISQLQDIEYLLNRRRTIFQALKSAASSQTLLPLDEQEVPYRFVLLCEDTAKRNELQVLFHAKGIETSSLFGYDNLLHTKLQLPDSDYVEACSIVKRSLSLPCFPALSYAALGYLVHTTESILLTY